MFIWDGNQDLDMEDEVPVRPAANAEEAKEIMASIEEKKVRLAIHYLPFRSELTSDDFALPFRLLNFAI